MVRVVDVFLLLQRVYCNSRNRLARLFPLHRTRTVAILVGGNLGRRGVYLEDHEGKEVKKLRLNPEWVNVDKRQKLAHKIAVEAGYPKGFIYDFDQTPLRFEEKKSKRPDQWPDQGRPPVKVKKKPKK